MVSSEELRLYRSVYLNRVAQSYIFAAGADAEAERAAEDFMLRLYCEHKIGCGVCPECRKVKQKNHVDILEISSDGTIKREQVEPIVDFISKKAYEKGYKCVLIKRAHDMGEVSQNFLLKPIEEPPEGVVFILTTSAPDKLLTTIRSRSVLIRIPPMPRREILFALNQSELASAAAAQSGGSLSEAKALLKDEAFFNARQSAFELSQMLIKYKKPSIYKMSELALAHDMLAILTALYRIFRDALYLSLTGDSDFLFNPDQVEDISAIREIINDSGLMQICDIIIQTMDRKRLSPGVNSAAAIRSMLFNITEVRNRCLK